MQNGRGIAAVYRLVKVDLYRVDLSRPRIGAVHRPGDGDWHLHSFGVVVDSDFVIAAGEIDSGRAAGYTLWYICTLAGEIEINLLRILRLKVAIRCFGLHHIIGRVGSVARPFIAAADLQYTLLSDIGLDRGIILGFIHGEFRTRQQLTGQLVELDKGQLVVDVGIVINNVEAIGVVVGVDFKLVGVFLHVYTIPLISQRDSAVEIGALNLGVFLNKAIQNCLLKRRAAGAAGVEVHGAVGKLRIAVGLHFHPFPGDQVFLLEDKADRIFLFVGQGIVAGEALGDIHARRLRIAAHLEHVAIKVAVFSAVVRVIGDLETIESIILQIIGKASVCVLRHGRRDHLQVIDGVFTDGNNTVVQRHIHITVVTGRKRNRIARLRSGPICNRSLVCVQQTEDRTAKALLHMVLSVGIEPDGVDTVRAFNIRARGGEGFGFAHRRAEPGGKAAVLSDAELGCVAEGRLLTRRAGDPGFVCDGNRRLVRDGEGACVAAVVIGCIGVDRNAAVINGLVAGEGILQGEAVAAVERQAIRVNRNRVFGHVSAEGERLFKRSALHDLQGAVYGLGHDIVAGGVCRLTRSDAGEGHIIASHWRTGTGGGNTRKADAIQQRIVSADREAADRLFSSVSNLHAAFGGELDALFGDIKSPVLISNVIAGSDVLTVSIHDLRLGGLVFARAGDSLGAGHGNRLNAVALGKALDRVGLFRECRSVIDLIGAVGGDGQFPRRYLQGAVCIGDGIVIVRVHHGIIFHRTDDLHVRGDVVALAHQGLGAVDGQAFKHVAVGKAGAGIAFVLQLGAVVFLFGAVGSDGDGFFRHCQGAGHIGDVVVACNIRARGVHNMCIPNHVIRCGLRFGIITYIHVSLRAFYGDGLDRVACSQPFRSISVVGKHIAVIDLGLAGSGNTEGSKLNSENAVDVAHAIIPLLRITGDGDGIRTHSLALGAAQAVIEGVGSDQSCYGRRQFGVGIAVGLALGIGCHGDGSLGDGGRQAYGAIVVMALVALHLIINNIFSGIGRGGKLVSILPFLRQAVEHGTTIGSSGGHKLLGFAGIDKVLDRGGSGDNIGVGLVAVRVRHPDLHRLAVFEREKHRLFRLEGRKGAEQPVRVCLLDFYVCGIGEADIGHIGKGDLRHAEPFKQFAEGDLALARDGVGIIAPVEVHRVGAHQIDGEALRQKAHTAALDGKIGDLFGAVVVVDVPYLECGHRHLADGGVGNDHLDGAVFGLVLLPVTAERDVVGGKHTILSAALTGLPAGGGVEGLGAAHKKRGLRHGILSGVKGVYIIFKSVCSADRHILRHIDHDRTVGRLRTLRPFVRLRLNKSLRVAGSFRPGLGFCDRNEFLDDLRHSVGLGLLSDSGFLDGFGPGVSFGLCVGVGLGQRVGLGLRVSLRLCVDLGFHVDFRLLDILRFLGKRELLRFLRPGSRFYRMVTRRRGSFSRCRGAGSLCLSSLCRRLGLVGNGADVLRGRKGRFRIRSQTICLFIGPLRIFSRSLRLVYRPVQGVKRIGVDFRLRRRRAVYLLFAVVFVLVSFAVFLFVIGNLFRARGVRLRRRIGVPGRQLFCRSFYSVVSFCLIVFLCMILPVGALAGFGVQQEILLDSRYELLYIVRNTRGLGVDLLRCLQRLDRRLLSFIRIGPGPLCLLTRLRGSVRRPARLVGGTVGGFRRAQGCLVCLLCGLRRSGSVRQGRGLVGLTGGLLRLKRSLLCLVGVLAGCVRAELSRLKRGHVAILCDLLHSIDIDRVVRIGHRRPHCREGKTLRYHKKHGDQPAPGEAPLLVLIIYTVIHHDATSYIQSQAVSCRFYIKHTYANLHNYTWFNIPQMSLICKVIEDKKQAI